MNNRVFTPIELKSNSKTARLLILSFLVLLITQILLIVVAFFERFAIYRLMEDKEVSDFEQIFIEESDILFSIFFVAVNVFIIFLFFTWFYKTYKNLNYLRTKPLQYSFSWAILGFIIPLVNLFYPYKIAIKIVEEFDLKLKLIQNNFKENKKSIEIIGLWWLFFWISNITSKISESYYDKLEQFSEFEDFLNSNSIDLIHYFLTLISIITTIFMVKNISEKETLLIQKLPEINALLKAEQEPKLETEIFQENEEEKTPEIIES
ncbi:DUF4328 domain-containing protein [Aureivirga marina]|uniref:DUF4328 domain-containing protein n=1 Tax=Aureivirga marina TaxID=1182451 RepID=UPI0018CBEC71|nr:DUF4328 domain-containing protein [Aureivirga marina]